MTPPSRFAVRAGADVRLVPDQAYVEELRRMVRRAQDRVWCSIFIVELDRSAASQDPVLELLRDVQFARWQGVDTRLVLGGSRSNLQIAEVVATSLEIARGLGIPARGLGRSGVRGSHMKVAIADDWVLTGSHNWSPGAFGGQAQDSVLVHSPDLAAGMCGVFLDQWQRAADGDVQQ